MNLKKVIKLFEQGNVCVTGLRGTGKDMLTANVIHRRNENYVSNVNYGLKNACLPLDMRLLDIHNKSDNFISGDIVPYEYPYPEKADIYISDASVYFPSQDFAELNKKYPTFVNFQALSRHLGDCNVHVNCQNLNRLWDKIREQSDIYIRCESCKVWHGFVFQIVTIYDKYESCVSRVKPFKSLRVPLLNKAGQRELILNENERYKREFEERNGSVKRLLLIYKNKSSYDTRLFKRLLGGNVSRGTK